MKLFLLHYSVSSLRVTVLDAAMERLAFETLASRCLRNVANLNYTKLLSVIFFMVTYVCCLNIN